MRADDENPYRPAPGSAPPAMAGRDAELSAAAYAGGLTRGGGAAQPIVFTGLRGMGKTALLRRCVATATEAGAVVLYTEASRETHLAASLRRSLEHAKSRYGSLPAKLRGAFDAAIETLPKASFEMPGGGGTLALEISRAPKTHESFVEALEALNVAVRRHGHYLLLAIDEIQDGAPDDLRILVRFVHLTAGTDEPVLLLGAGLPNAPAHLHGVRTYTERWRFLRIGLLDAAETAEAILDPATALGVEIEEPALERLVSECGGYPFFVQEYASAAWVAHRGTTISSADVEASAPGVRRILEAGFYDERFRTLTPRELRYVLELARLGPGSHSVGDVAAALGTTSAVLSSVRNQLVRKDVVFAPSPGLIEFRMPLTDIYVERNRENLERRAAIGR